MDLYPCTDQFVILDSGLMFSKWNTLSNISYFIVGIIGIILTYYRTKLLTKKRNIQYWSMQNMLCSDLELFLLHGWIVVIGVCSVIYHSTLQTWSICMDYFSIEIFTIILSWILLCKILIRRYSKPL